MFYAEYQTEVAGKLRDCMNPAKGWVLSDMEDHYLLWASGSPYSGMEYRIQKDAPWCAILALMGRARLREFGNETQWDLYALHIPPEGALPREEALAYVV